MRYIMMMILTLSCLVACGPSETDFEGSCLARCGHEIVHCGRPLDPGYYSCLDLCGQEWDDMQDQSADCQWFMVYWYDCRTDTPCERLDASCLPQLADVAAECL